MLSQKQAVTNAVLAVLPDYQLGGEVVLKDIMSKSNKQEITSIVTQGFIVGEVSLSNEAKAKYLHDESALASYTSSMVDNWVRRNPDFNNGRAYAPKNPGSRAGQGDDQIKALRALKKQMDDPATIAEIDEAIQQRLAEIKPKFTVTIDIEALPENLRHLAK